MSRNVFAVAARWWFQMESVKLARLFIYGCVWESECCVSIWTQINSWHGSSSCPNCTCHSKSLGGCSKQPTNQQLLTTILERFQLKSFDSCIVCMYVCALVLHNNKLWEHRRLVFRAKGSKCRNPVLYIGVAEVVGVGVVYNDECEEFSKQWYI